MLSPPHLTPHLTSGALSKILQQGLLVEEIGEIKLQILLIKKIPSEPENFQIIFSDGLYVWPHSIYHDPDDINAFVLDKFSIVALHSFKIQLYRGRKTISMNGGDLEYLEFWPKKIGKPKALDLSLG